MRPEPDKSPLTIAAYRGDEAEVRALLASGADASGADNRAYDGAAQGCRSGSPYYRPLSEAARGGHPAIVERLLAAGAPIDAPNYRNETALILAAGSGQEETVRVLLRAGADPHAVSCFGNALAAASVAASKPCVRRLLEAGVSPTVKDPFGATALDRLLAQLGRADAGGAVRAAAFELLELLRPHAGADAARVEAAIAGERRSRERAAEREAAVVAAFERLGAPREVARWGWAWRVRRHIRKLPNGASGVERLCRLVLGAAAPVAHPAWPALVREVLALSHSYEDVTLATYGVRARLEDMDEDEGGALERYADEHLYTFDWVLQALSTAAAVSHPAWADLVAEVCGAKQSKIGDQSFADEEVLALLAQELVRRHPRYRELRARAAEAFPLAGWSKLG